MVIIAYTFVTTRHATPRRDDWFSRVAVLFPRFPTPSILVAVAPTMETGQRRRWSFKLSCGRPHGRMPLDIPRLSYCSLQGGKGTCNRSSASRVGGLEVGPERFFGAVNDRQANDACGKRAAKQVVHPVEEEPILFHARRTAR